MSHVKLQTATKHNYPNFILMIIKQFKLCISIYIAGKLFNSVNFGATQTSGRCHNIDVYVAYFGYRVNRRTLSVTSVRNSGPKVRIVGIALKTFRLSCFMILFYNNFYYHCRDRTILVLCNWLSYTYFIDIFISIPSCLFIFHM